MELGVNIDHVATLRNARGGVDPNVLKCAKICESIGVSCITTHLREDRRHIVDTDVRMLRDALETRLNLEMAMTEEMKKIALEIMPAACCIVPENRDELTTEGGLNVLAQTQKIQKFIAPLSGVGIEVSLFIDPNLEQVYAASKAGAQVVELHTGAYAEAFGGPDEDSEVAKLKEAALFAQSLGLKVNAGHGLNYQNVHRMKEIPDLSELNIGHSIISRAMFIGIAGAVREMKELLM